MRKKLTITAIIITILLALALILFVGIPKYKFSKDYELPKGLTPEQTIREFFEYIDGNNPKKANLISIEARYDEFSFNTITSASVDNIEYFGIPSNWNKYGTYYDSKEFLVNYECCYLPFAEEKVLFGPTGSIFFSLIKESKDSDWKIADIYTGP
ncbi:MAG: DUF4829 domain-containing protein [Ruminococcus sp.]|nr:DUF4829 domain-containing protein [Ruminococcus sp.]